MTRVALLRSGKITAWALTLVLALSLVFVAGQNSAEAQKTPAANKVAVVGSGATITFEQESDEELGVEVLKTTMKNPGSKALVLSVTLECSILTSLVTVGNDLSQAEAKAKVWVEVNGNPVMFDDDATDGGKVTFCEREYQRQTSEWQDEDAIIDDFIRTKASHGFNWVALHDGPGDKEIVVKADLTRNATDNATAALVIGHRTLTVEPVDVVKDESLSN